MAGKARTSRVIFGGLPRITSSGTSTGRLQQRIAHVQPAVVGDLADDRKRTAFAFAQCGKALS